MRPLHFALGAALALLATRGDSAPPWKEAADRIAFPLAQLSFPATAGSMAVTESGEASRKGEALDNVVQYASKDKAVFGTIYIYYPGLPHAGLAAIATDWVIRQNAPNIRGGAIRSVAAGGTAGTALRFDYEGYRSGLITIAAFLKRDRWIIGVRVSGPPGRRAEVETAAASLLDGLRLGGTQPPRTLQPLAIQSCPKGGDQRPAKLLPDNKAIMPAQGFVGTFDGAGMQATDEPSNKIVYLPGRVPTEFCRASLSIKGGTLPLLRAVDGEPLFADGRTVRIVLLNDAGRMLEVDHSAKLGGYVLLFHDLGATNILGTYDGIPSDAQLAAILDGDDKEGGRFRVPVELSPLRGPSITLPSMDAKDVAPEKKPIP